MSRFAVLTLILVSLLLSEVHSSNPVVEWNNLTLSTIASTSTPPTVASRVLAILNVAIYDAVVSISPKYIPFNITISSPRDGSLAVAVAAAARYTLVSLFPSYSTTFNNQFFADISQLPASLSITDGIYAGEAAAQGVLQLRLNDSGLDSSFHAGSGPGNWQPTPPGYLAPETPEWGQDTPWCFTNVSELLGVLPPSLSSSKYTNDHNQVYSLGSLSSSLRTPDQTEIANFWNSNSPLEIWLSVAATFATNLSIVDSARLYAALSVAQADAAISAWQAIYDFAFWRPVTAIQKANTTSNSQLSFDPSWTPLVTTPNWPEFPSDQAIFGGAASQVFIDLFGDNNTFSISVGNMTRSYTSFSSAALEESQSVIFAGINFNNSAVLGLTYGNLVGSFVIPNCFRVSPPPLPNYYVTASWIFGCMGLLGVITIIFMFVWSHYHPMDTTTVIHKDA